ncbi:MAG TPA: GNAT family N-acetyltransferase [Ignavibacteriaceae bacterium]|nr:GNAT family N-acetyltransferase [Ignavibacteriaceae bacterium]
MDYQKDDLIIRSAENKDVTNLLKLIKELAEYENLSHLVIADEILLSRSLFGKNSSVNALIAEFKGETAGMAIYFFNFSTFLGRPGIYLEDLFIRPQFRGLNIGKTLLIELVKIAKQKNCGRVEWAVLDWNLSAIEFYKKLGAEPVNDWTIFRLTEDKINELASQ